MFIRSVGCLDNHVIAKKKKNESLVQDTTAFTAKKLPDEDTFTKVTKIIKKVIREDSDGDANDADILNDYFDFIKWNS